MHESERNRNAITSQPEWVKASRKKKRMEKQIRGQRGAKKKGMRMFSERGSFPSEHCISTVLQRGLTFNSTERDETQARTE